MLSSTENSIPHPLTPFPPHRTLRSNLRHALDAVFPHQLIPTDHLDHPAPDHPWVYRDRFPHIGLDFRRGVEAEDEVMARVVLLLVLPHWFGKEKGPPVGEGADDAAVLEEEGAGLVGDSDGMG